MDANIPPTPEVRQVESESAMVQDLFIQHLNAGKSFNEILDILSSDERISENVEIDIRVSAIGSYQGYDVAGTVDVSIARGSDGMFSIVDHNVVASNSAVRINNSEDIVRSILNSKNLSSANIAIRGTYQSYAANVNAKISVVTVTIEGEDRTILKAVMKDDGTFEELSSNVQRAEIGPNVVFRDSTSPATTPTESSGTGDGDIPLPQARTTDLETRSTATQSNTPNRTLTPQGLEQITGIENVLVVDEDSELQHAFPINTAFKLKGYPEVIMAINHRAQVLVLNIDGTVKSIPTASESAVRDMIENKISLDLVNNRATINFK